MTKQISSSDYYRAARDLLPEMEESTRRAIEELLVKADSGAKTDNLIVEIICKDSALRKKFRTLLNVSDRTLSDYSGLIGNPSSPKAQTFICPRPGHDFTRRIQKVGEDPGFCPEHNLHLIPVDQKKGG